MLGVVRDKVLGVLRKPYRTLVASHRNNNDDDLNTNDNNNNNNNNEDRLYRKPQLPYIRFQQWTPVDVPTSTEPQMSTVMVGVGLVALFEVRVG